MRASIPTAVFALTALTFVSAATMLVTQAAPSGFYAPVRARGLLPFDSTVILVSGQLDGLLMAAAAGVLATILMLASRERSGRARWLPRLGAALAVCLALWLVLGEWLLPPVVVVGGVAIIYSVVRSSVVIREAPSVALRAMLVPGAILLATLGAASFSRWVLNMVDGAVPFTDWSWSASLLELKLSNVLYPLLPRLTFLFLLAWAVRLVVSLFWDDLGRFYSGALRSFSVVPEEGAFTVGGKGTLLVLALSLVFDVLVGVYAYVPAINVKSSLVGVDVVQFYQGAAQAMVGTSPPGAVSYAFANDRTLYLLFQYALAEAAGSVGLAIRAMPAILSVLLSLSTFWFARAATQDDLVSCTAALIAPFSFMATAGIDGGLYANWLAVAETFGFFAALLQGTRGSPYRNLPAAAGLSILLLFTHPWTWFAAIGILLVYAASSVVLAVRSEGGLSGSRRELAFLGAVLLANLLGEASKRFLPTGSGISAVYGYTLTGVNLLNAPLVVGSLETTLTGYLAGALASPPTILLAIVGVLALRDLREGPVRLLFCWATVASVGAILASSSPGFLQSRVLYIIPFQVLAAIGFVAILRFLVAAASAPITPAFRTSTLLAVLFYAILVSGLASFALQTIGYLYS